VIKDTEGDYICVHPIMRDHIWKMLVLFICLFIIVIYHYICLICYKLLFIISTVRFLQMKGYLEVGVIKFYPTENPPINYDRIEGMYIFFSFCRVYHLFFYRSLLFPSRVCLYIVVRRKGKKLINHFDI
jgi:hypothetical protein